MIAPSDFKSPEPAAKKGTQVRSKPAVDLKRIGLRYVSDAVSGLSRVRKKGSGKSFSYFTTSHKRLTHPPTLQRIQSLTIPPAWTGVWICPSANGYLQATGRDARGRKQYRYHPNFRQHQEISKFANIIDFAHALPHIRRRVRRDLNRRGLPRERVIATIVQLLERTLIRVGNREYAEHNHSFGLSTLQNKHIRHSGSGVRFTFVGKSGVPHEVEIADQKLANIVFRCHDLPGQHLFEYQDHDGAVHELNSSDVNEYIRECAKDDFTAKNFRTWKGTVMAALAFEKLGQPKSPMTAQKLIARVIKEVAAELRNTPATCRKYYVHPELVAAVEAGDFCRLMSDAHSQVQQKIVNGLSQNEAAVLYFLEHIRHRNKKATTSGVPARFKW